MVLIVLLLFLALVAIATGLAFLLGFRIGGTDSRNQVAQVKVEAARAQRELLDLNRRAFIAMAEHVQAAHEERRGGQR